MACALRPSRSGGCTSLWYPSSFRMCRSTATMEGRGFFPSTCGSWLPTLVLERPVSKWWAARRLQYSCGLSNVSSQGQQTRTLHDKDNGLRQECQRLGSESLQASKVSPASNILPAVSDKVEPYVRSLCGSSDHPSSLSRHQRRSVRGTQRGSVVTSDGLCRKTPRRRRGSPG